MPYANSYHEDEDGRTITWPWGAKESYSDVMGRGAGVENLNYPIPSAPAKSTYTGIYGTQPPPAASSYVPTKPNYATLGNQPFFIPSGAGRTTSRYPGLTQPGGSVMPAPSMPAMPTFEIPKWDESKIESKAQRAAGPGLRELRKGMREAQGRYYENPNVRRMTLRDAMAGYGMGLEKVLGGARREAATEYAAEYAPQMTKAQMEYQGQMQGMMAQYQAAWKEYLTRMQTVTD